MNWCARGVAMGAASDWQRLFAGAGAAVESAGLFFGQTAGAADGLDRDRDLLYVQSAVRVLPGDS